MGKENVYIDKSETNSEHSEMADEDINDVTTEPHATFSVDYETRDGVAKYSKDYKNTHGTLVRKFCQCDNENVPSPKFSDN